MRPDEPTPEQVIIIGSGVAGLTAALHLAERGLRPLVLEADPRFVGGRLAGKEEIEINGHRFRLEHGVHGIWSQYRNFQAMLARHNLRPVFVPAQEELWIYRAHAWTRSAPIGRDIRYSIFPPPLHYLQLFLNPRFLFTIDFRDWLGLLNVWYTLIMAVGVDPYGEHQPLTGLTLGQSLRHWPPALKALFIGLARNGLSTHANEIPLAGFLAFLRFYTLLRRDAWAFSYLPNDGGTDVCEPLAAKIRQLGGEIRLGVRVNRLEKAGEAWRLWAEGDAPSGGYRSKYILLATDSPAAESILKNSFPAESASFTFPRGLGNAIVRLWFDTTPKPGPEGGMFSGDFILHNFFWLHRIYAPYRAWHKTSGGSAIEIHIYGPDDVLAQPDALLLTHAIRDFWLAHPELRGHLLGQHLQRNPASHTLPMVGPRGQHPAVQTPWPGLFLAGDWVYHPTPAFFIERATVTGIAAANGILQAEGLAPWPLVEHLPPEPFAAWIERLMRAGRQRRREQRNKAQNQPANQKNKVESTHD